MPAKASPTFMALMAMELVPMAWMTMVMVPAFSSQSASVSGISSPLSQGSTRTNWPARADLAISGALTVNSTMFSASSNFSRMVKGAAPSWV